jgi:hypothetical protein|tara:strand:- start:10826 stop:12055 length:1230 start_codon:yes stop_codon:yes gene_type:complete
MYEVLTGKQRSLVFPIMCNAFVKMSYDDNIPNTDNAGTFDDVGYGLWAHKGSFSFEALITPYEINGNSTHQTAVDLSNTALGVGNTRNDSKKIMAGLLQETYDLGASDANDETEMQNELYLSRANRITHEMMIFDNDNFTISLVNSTTHTQNNPAQYKIKATVKIGSTTKTVTSDVVIKPSQGHSFRYNTTNTSNLFSGFNKAGRVMFAKVAEVHTNGAEDNIDLPLASATHPFITGQEIFYRSSGTTFTSLGTIYSVSGSDLEMNAATPALAGGTDLFLPTYKHPTYIDQMFHVGCVYNDKTKLITLYLNGIPIKSDTHSETATFEFAKTDIYLGSNGLNDMTVSGIYDTLSGGTATGINGATTCKQFMGEFHELAISNKITSFTSIDNLMPNFNDALLYLRFEEVDL